MCFIREVHSWEVFSGMPIDVLGLHVQVPQLLSLRTTTTTTDAPAPALLRSAKQSSRAALPQLEQWIKLFFDPKNCAVSLELMFWHRKHITNIPAL